MFSSSGPGPFPVQEGISWGYSGRTLKGKFKIQEGLGEDFLASLGPTPSGPIPNKTE